MMKTTTTDNAGAVLEGFKHSNTQATLNKIKRFRAAGPANIHVLLDFDRTMTIGKQGQDDATSWQILRRHLPPEGQAKYQEYYQRYRQSEIAGTMTQADALEWWQSIQQLFVDGRVNLKKVEQGFLAVVNLRPGTHELLAACHRGGLQTTILSAGIADVIQILLNHYGVAVDLVISNWLTTDANGTITGWSQDDVVHVLNKHEAGHAQLGQVKAIRPYCIVLGDSLDDAAMITGNDNVLRIRVIDSRAGETADPVQLLRRTFETFDLAVTSGNLQAVADLVDSVTGATGH